MEETKQPESQPPTIYKWVKMKGETPDIYSNFLQVSWTLHDVRFVLGQLVPSDPISREFVVDERGTVTVTWAQVKNLRDIFASLIKKYEETNGEIKPVTLPPAG
jgi:hypothetical protein